MIDIIFDEIVPCLKRVSDGEIVGTYIKEISNRNKLSGFNKATKWYVDWSRMPKDCHIFALYVKSDADVQGLIALRDVKEYNAVEIHWVCTAPQNNYQLRSEQKYLGVGAHLFAHAANYSKSLGYEGCFFGHAKSKEILKYYIDNLSGFHCPTPGHPYQFIVEEVPARKLMEVYDYEWKTN